MRVIICTSIRVIICTSRRVIICTSTCHYKYQYNVIILTVCVSLYVPVYVLLYVPVYACTFAFIVRNEKYTDNNSKTYNQCNSKPDIGLHYIHHSFTKQLYSAILASVNKNLLSIRNFFGVLSRLCQGKC